MTPRGTGSSAWSGSGERVRLVAVSTHPIQYHVPLYRRLFQDPRLDFSVLFAHRPSRVEQGEGFGVDFEWDVDLTTGFAHDWLRNRARRPSVTRFWGCNTPGVGKVLREKRADAVLVTGWNSLSLVQATLAAGRLRVPVLVRGDSHLDTTRSGLRRAVKEVLYPLWLSRFAVCLAVGRRSEEYFRHYGARTVVRSTHFVDNAWFAERARAAAGEREQLRSKWGCSQKTFLFLFAGKLQDVKRPEDAIEGLRRCWARGGDAELLMVGDGALRRACEAAAERARVPVRFAGFVNQSEMPRVYAAADALVLPSQSETWGLVVNEAMACGIPAIVSDRVGCAPDLICDRTGAMFPCADVEALGLSMYRLAAAPEHARSLGAAAQEWVKPFSAEQAAAGVMEGLSAAGVVRHAG